MMTVSMHEIQTLVYEFGGRVNAPVSLLSVRFLPADDGAPYVEIKEGVFNYVSSERGYEIYRKSTHSLDELLYWILSRAARQMAMKYELNNRSKGIDTRRVYFSKFIQLVGGVKAEWEELAKLEVDNTLKTSPYIDG